MVSSLTTIRFSIAFFLFALIPFFSHAQEVISLYNGKAPGSEAWKHEEKIYRSGGEDIAYNVVNPTLTVYKPAPGNANGTAIVVCPGGAFHILSMNNEGSDVAKWLNSLGITAFVLKYRLVESKTTEPLQELGAKMRDFKKLDEENALVVPLAIEDGRQAISYVRKNAAQYGIDPKKIGIMGFSAGGTVTAGVTFSSTAESRPDFAAPIYLYLDALGPVTVPADAPPLFIAVASDDELGFVPQSIRLYNLWQAAKKRVELHVFSKGGHGFGMRKAEQPVGKWTELFANWLRLEGYLK